MKLFISRKALTRTLTLWARDYRKLISDHDALYMAYQAERQQWNDRWTPEQRHNGLSANPVGHWPDRRASGQARRNGCGACL